MTPEPTPLLCPSSPGRAGASIIGVVGADGRVGFLHDRLPVTDEFLLRAALVGPTEKRFRFASPCIQRGCMQWEDDHCGIADQVIRAADAARIDTEVPDCSIRPVCRWYSQRGYSACRVCPFVITDCTT